MCYKGSANQATAGQAKSECEALRAVLASVHNGETATFINTLMNGYGFHISHQSLSKWSTSNQLQRAAIRAKLINNQPYIATDSYSHMSAYWFSVSPCHVLVILAHTLLRNSPLKIHVSQQKCSSLFPDFQSRLLIGWHHNRQPIRSHVRKF